MFQFTYAKNELRRRLGRTLLTALGLAAGVGLVIGIIGVSQGLDDAQAQVLAPLRSIGTDILVTRVAGATSEDPPAEQPQGGAGPGFFGPGIGRAGGINATDAQALLQENSSVLTDLSKLGKPGAKFSHDFFLAGTMLSFPDEALDQVRAIDGVTSATAGLTSTVQHQSGTVPRIVAEFQTGGDTITQTVRPPELTDAERKAMRTCLEKSGAMSSGPPQPDQGGGRNFDAFQKCLPQRLKEFRAKFVTPRETIRRLINPPQTNTTNTSYTAAGIDPASPKAGLVTTEQLTGGDWLSPTATTEVLASAAYANKRSLKVGSTVTINGTAYSVVGIVNPTLTGSTADLYFPLATLQKLASKQGRVTHVLVRVDDADRVDAVAAKISDALPGAQVVTTKSLADQVTGSLKDARNVASRLGGALGAIVLGAAFIIAMLLTLSSVAKRVREIGTLRAIGWSKGRVVRQILAETIGIGVVGAVLGIALGYAAAWAVGAFSPELNATSAGVLAQSSFTRLIGGAQSAATTTRVALTAPIHLSTLGLGAAFAIVGGSLAGLAGGWRAARLAPAEALRNIG